MKLTDITGEIYEGMWGYGDPFPDFRMHDLKLPDWVDYKSYSQAFGGMHILTGTYIVAPSHGLGIKESYPLSSIKMQDLYEIDACVLKFDLNDLKKDGNNPYISYENIKNAEKETITEGKAVLFSTGWGKHWGKDDYLKNFWFLKKEALEYILSKKPFLIGLDSPAMDNIYNPQGLSSFFYKKNVLLLAPLVNLENIRNFRVKLTVSPLNIPGTTGSPCRAVVIEE